MANSSAAAPSDPPPPPVDAAPTWRRQPYRLFFPLGLVHLWAGLSPWLLLALGHEGHDTQVFHSIAQIQGFMLCFALGFLLTMIPRRTRTEAPNVIEMLIGLVSPVGITVCAAFEWLAASQWFWFAVVTMLVTFVLRRFRRAARGRGALPGFVWVPIAFAMGLTGSLLFGVYGALGDEYFRVHELAQMFLLQGLFLGLVMGVGSMVFPLFTRGESPPDASPADGRKRIVHLVAAAALIGSFFLQAFLPRTGGPNGYEDLAHHVSHLVRAAVCGFLLTWSGGIHHAPTLPGLNRKLVWIAAWMVPAGYTVAGVMPPHQVQAGLHLVFIGGFATMAFAVACHVALAHAGRKAVLAGWPWQVVAYGVLFLVAVAARVTMPLDPERYLLWLGIASGAFLLGTLAWAALVIPALMRRG
jgi:uncharacterized protein involved in response to NO